MNPPPPSDNVPSITMSSAALLDDDDELIAVPLVETQPNDSQDSNPSSQEVRMRQGSIWGALVPTNPTVDQIEFGSIKTTYSIGRAPNNDIVLKGLKISNQHCTIKFLNGEVIVLDTSSNGTYISGTRIGYLHSRVLREGNELTLGAVRPSQNSTEDYRWLFRSPRPPPFHPHDDSSNFWSRYDLGQELGRGTFANVYRCMERRTGNWYAVKIIQRQKWAASPINERNFAREIGILMKLDHPNIIKLKEVVHTAQTIYLIMEEVNNGELLHLISRVGGLEESQAQFITHQICSAMAYIHGHGIAHRDLKPENVLIHTDEETRIITCKIGDFGLAKFFDDKTFLRTMCGTPAYLAPEVVLRGYPEEGYDHLVDSWSLGAIVYAMVTNASPFHEDECAPIRKRIAERVIHWDYLESRNISPAAKHFIKLLLTVDPTKRMSLEEALSHPWLASPPPEPIRAASSEASLGANEDHHYYNASASFDVSQKVIHYPHHGHGLDPDEGEENEWPMEGESMLAHPGSSVAEGGVEIDDVVMSGDSGDGECDQVLEGLNIDSENGEDVDETRMNTGGYGRGRGRGGGRGKNAKMAAASTSRGGSRQQVAEHSRAENVPVATPMRLSMAETKNGSPMVESPELTSSGGVKVPGFSPLSSDTSQPLVMSPKGKAAVGVPRPLTGKRKVKDRSGVFEDPASELVINTNVSAFYPDIGNSFGSSPLTTSSTGSMLASPSIAIGDRRLAGKTPRVMSSDDEENAAELLHYQQQAPRFRTASTPASGSGSGRTGARKTPATRADSDSADAMVIPNGLRGSGVTKKNPARKGGK